MENKGFNNTSKLYIQVDIEGYITAIAQEANEGHMETEITMEEFLERYGAENVTDGTHKYINGEILCDGGTERSRRINAQRLKQELRERRAQECYLVVNRGQVWYDKLTAEQKNELLCWYEAWLNVTETLNVPKMPSWLKD